MAHTTRVTIEQDCDHGAPWEECDGHGEVSDWTTRDKRAWCNDEWCYVVAHVELLDEDGEVVADSYVGGVESDYVDDTAREMEQGLRAQHEHECGERAHWAARGVVTEGARP